MATDIQINSRSSRVNPGSIGWWGRLLAAVLFAFYLNYLPLHLVAQPHWHDQVPKESARGNGPGHHHHPGHDGHEDHHAPHPASEHTVQLRAKSEPLTATVALLAATIEVAIPEPDSRVIVVAADEGFCFAEAPPDPARPRAPPVV